MVLPSTISLNKGGRCGLVDTVAQVFQKQAQYSETFPRDSGSLAGPGLVCLPPAETFWRTEEEGGEAEVTD